MTGLPAPDAQVDRLVELGLHEIAGLDADQLRASANAAMGLLVLDPVKVPPSTLAPLVVVDGRPGFIVGDMTDVDAFEPIDSVTVPRGPAYSVGDPDRGDAMANWSPDEALPEIEGGGRTPLTLTEGLHWILQCPEVLTRNYCFMTIGSRLRKPGGALDTRTPALWLSNGTGRDGTARRDAPKVGWCWAGNRHTWLGFGSAAWRRGLG